MNETFKKDLCTRLNENTLYRLNEKGLFNLDSEFGHPSGAYEDLKITNVLKSDKIEIELESVKSGWSIGFIDIDEVYPILFHISCLTKEITVNGETFVPIERLGEELKMNVIEYCMIKENPQLIIETARFIVIEKFNEWHINYRLDKDQFIEATNEYE